LHIPVIFCWISINLLKQNVGVDISKDSFVATFAIMLQGQIIETKRTRNFKNTTKGITEFIEWVNKLKSPAMDLHVTMEATGVYYEESALCRDPYSRTFETYNYKI
jgi:transposase